MHVQEYCHTLTVVVHFTLPNTQVLYHMLLYLLMVHMLNDADYKVCSRSRPFNIIDLMQKAYMSLTDYQR